MRSPRFGCEPLGGGAAHGPDIKLPDLLGVIAQCPKWGSMDDPCDAAYARSSRIDA
jgi:hypothetical protein